MHDKYSFHLNNSRGCQSDIYDEIDKLPTVKRISFVYLCGVFLSVITHFLDMALDINLAYQYYHYSENAYFILTLIFTLIPSVIIAFVSIRIYTLDEDVCLKNNIFRSILLLLQFAPILRCCELINYAVKCRNSEKSKNLSEHEKYYALVIKEDSNIALIRILESFLESGPQTTLQIAILLNGEFKERDDWLRTYQLVSLSISIISMSWSIVLYNRSIRFAAQELENIPWTASIVLFTWHFLIVGSRILSTSEVASVFPRSTIFCCILHCLLTGLYLCLREPSQFCTIRGYNFCSKLIEMLFCFTLGFVYLFVYVSTVEGKTRNKYSTYYTIYFAEILIAATVWYLYCAPATSMFVDRQQWLIALYITTVSVFPIGILFMTIYYCYLHPTLNKRSSFDISIKGDYRDKEEEEEEENNCREILKMNNIGTQTDGVWSSLNEEPKLKSIDLRYVIDGWLIITAIGTKN